MKIAILNKSDSTGGAAVVSRRLMEALRKEGVDTRMVVTEKLSDSPYVSLAASNFSIKKAFFTERLKIFAVNGFDRKTLFKIDTGEEGLPLWKNKFIKEADAILINWVNQGMLSLKGVRKILAIGKPVIITMHDMWWMTGICHHAGECQHYKYECGDCPLLKNGGSPHDLSYKIHKKKKDIYSDKDITRKMAFVAVSTWLENKSLESSLLKNCRTKVIPNAFSFIKDSYIPLKRDKIRILFGAARLDDPIKGLDTLKTTSEILKNKYPDISSKMEIAVFGKAKNPGSLDGFSLPLVNLGLLRGEKELARIYCEADILVSSSSYETLPGTLVEAQAYGCIPVCFDRGGQGDIIQHEDTGFMVKYDDNLNIRACNLAEGIIQAVKVIENPACLEEFKIKMKESVTRKFSYSSIASRYIDLIDKLGAET
ncbi:MAG: glycosyltransferase [Muribaculaceae bacterium]|nr:glycosyltransferase [Muribaculaceae bacterium]